MPALSKKKLRIFYAADKLNAVHNAELLAAEIGFDAVARKEIGIVAAELVSNIIRHAGSGELHLEQVKRNSNTGMQLVSYDQGPGIKEPNLVTADGYSDDCGLGYGLGSINRIMDELEIDSPIWNQRGCRVVCRKWLFMKEDAVIPSPLSFGVATRPLPGSKFNGDAYFLKTWGNKALLAVIDGLGHGQFAHRASQKARNYLQSHFDQPFGSLLMGVGRECLTTRGVVMALARFDWQQRTLHFTSVGNISTRIFGAPGDLNLPIRRGILGRRAPKPIISEHQWDPSYTLVMHSDGLRTHWGIGDVPGLTKMPAQKAAKRLLDSFSKQTDDAVVAVVKGVA